MPDSAPDNASPDSEATADEESSPAVERRWRPVADAPFRTPTSSEAEVPTDAPESSPDAPPGDEGPGQGDHDQGAPDPSAEHPPEPDPNQDGSVPPERRRAEESGAADESAGASVVPDGASESGSAPPEQTGPPSTGVPDARPSDSGDPGRNPTESQPDPADPDEAADTLPPQAPSDEERAAAREVNDEALTDDPDDGSWIEQVQDPPKAPPLDEEQADEEEFFTDEHRRAHGAEQVEEELQEFAYEINEGTADTEWTPSDREDHRIASMFARLVSKVAEDMSYQQVPGDEFWDPRKIMRRQIDRRPLQHCKMDYTKRRLALLVDTSPSCRDEAVFYSKVATGALLRDDIDIFLCPNGRIDAQFDPGPMRFVNDDRGAAWDLEGRVVLYFTDWDGTDEIVEHSRNCTLYWFDNCPPSNYWESARDRHQRVRLQYRGRHFHCPDTEAFGRLARKIRP
ncbi:hypothetical protein [Salinibacter ruber]|uniref:hypothetical protein n=1 Tax=Salinibacter ruber TaxID=146919 RepID=UPI002073EA71|nr:hypothetical protein [Salinibacter ruber]